MNTYDELRKEIKSEILKIYNEHAEGLIAYPATYKNGIKLINRLQEIATKNDYTVEQILTELRTAKSIATREPVDTWLLKTYPHGKIITKIDKIINNSKYHDLQPPKPEVAQPAVPASTNKTQPEVQTVQIDAKLKKEIEQNKKELEHNKRDLEQRRIQNAQDTDNLCLYEAQQQHAAYLAHLAWATERDMDDNRSVRSGVSVASGISVSSVRSAFFGKREFNSTDAEQLFKHADIQNSDLCGRFNQMQENLAAELSKELTNEEKTALSVAFHLFNLRGKYQSSNQPSTNEATVISYVLQALFQLEKSNLKEFFKQLIREDAYAHCDVKVKDRIYVAAKQMTKLTENFLYRNTSAIQQFLLTVYVQRTKHTPDVTDFNRSRIAKNAFLAAADLNNELVDLVERESAASPAVNLK